MSAALDRLTASVQANADATSSVLSLLSTISAEIRNNVGDDDALNALADKIDSENTTIAQAVTANTPAASPAASTVTDNTGTSGTGTAQP